MNQELELLNNTEKDLDWFIKNLDDLKERYDEQFVAIKSQRIIAFGKELKEVIVDIKEKKENPAMILIQFVSKIPVIL